MCIRDRLYLEWKASSNADGYKVYIVSGSTEYFKGDVQDSKFTFTDLTPVSYTHLYSQQTVQITATSAANNVSKTVNITVTGRVGNYLSDVEVTADSDCLLYTSRCV